MNEGRCCCVHWADKNKPMFYVLFDDQTWESFEFPEVVNGYEVKGFMNLRVCTQKKMTKEEVHEYINNKMKELV